MAAMDAVLKSSVPYYSQIKRGMAMVQKENRTQKRKKQITLTEYSQSGRKAILKDKVTVNQAAKKLFDYESTGLSPYEIKILIEREKNLARRVEQLEGY